MKLGLMLFSAIFLMGGWQQLTEPEPRAQMAVDAGLPRPPDVLVRFSGIAMILSAFGLQFRRTRAASAAVLVAQLPIVTFIGQRFWDLPSGPDRKLTAILFTKNVSLTGGALMILAYALSRRTDTRGNLAN